MRRSVKNILFSLVCLLLLFSMGSPVAVAKSKRTQVSPERWVHAFINLANKAQYFDQIAPYYLTSAKKRFRRWNKKAKVNKLNNVRRWTRTVQRIGKAEVKGSMAKVPLTSPLVEEIILFEEGDSWAFSNIHYRKGTTKFQKYGR